METFSTTENIFFPSKQDGNPILMKYNNLIINEGHTVTTSNRCKGLYLYIKGDLTVNGTLSMTARGSVGPGKYVAIDYLLKRIYYSDSNEIINQYPSNCVIYPEGGIGVKFGSNPGVNGACGSGGSALDTAGSNLYHGGNGTSFSGGAGAGGYVYSSKDQIYYYGDGKNDPFLGSGDNFGGQGGAAGYLNLFPNTFGGSGAGNPGGWNKNPSLIGNNGTGGLIILIVNGNIIFGPNGSIESRGSDGIDCIAPDNDGPYHHTVRGGSGSGGGAVHIFYKGTINRTDRIDVSGGKTGSFQPFEGGYYGQLVTRSTGYRGGNGSINLVKF